VVASVDFGTAELVPDAGHPDGWTLLVDGVPQSYVDMADPTRLKFEYVRRIASVVDVAGPAGAPLRILHLGGGALTLPRYVAATRPGSWQRVVERDAALDTLVRRVLPLPAGADLQLTVDDARAAVESGAKEQYDIIVADVYGGAQMPPDVASVQFAERAAALLRDGGIYAANVADLPPLMFTRIQAATLRAAFAEVCILADPGMLRGRRFGNVVLVATGEPGSLPLARLATIAARDPVRGRVLHGEELDQFVGGIGPMVDA
jgi:hypothetical protein